MIILHYLFTKCCAETLLCNIVLNSKGRIVYNYLKQEQYDLLSGFIQYGDDNIKTWNRYPIGYLFINSNNIVGI